MTGPTQDAGMVARLREQIISDAFERRVITSGQLAERLIAERRDAANEIERLQAVLASHSLASELGREPDDAMLTAGARSIGNSVTETNHRQRALKCWRAMWDATDGKHEPIPQGRALAKESPHV